MLTAEAPLLAMQISLDNANTDLEPYVVEAREVLRRYVLSLADQARQAAEEAEEAETRTESRADSEQQTANELAAEQRIFVGRGHLRVLEASKCWQGRVAVA